jgi:hypothetical protein
MLPLLLVANAIGSSGATVCLGLSVLRHRQEPGAFTGYSVGCYDNKINSGENSFVGPAQISRRDAHTLVIAFSAASIGNPSWYLWRVWTHAGDHLTYDLAPSAPGHAGPAEGRTVKQQLRFESRRRRPE